VAREIEATGRRGTVRRPVLFGSTSRSWTLRRSIVESIAIALDSPSNVQ
jgi:hypothetical protein